MKFFENSLPTYHRPSVRVRSALPPRALFTAYPDVLDKYDGMVRLNDDIVKYADSAVTARRQAENADAQYSHEVGEALRAGTDPSAVTNHRDSLLAQAVAFERLSTEAQTKAQAHGYELGEAIAEVAEQVAADAEARILSAVRELERIEQTKASYLASIKQAWTVRLSMSSLQYTGGQLSDHLPRSVQDPRAELNTLKAEEARVSERRAKEAASLASM